MSTGDAILFIFLSGLVILFTVIMINGNFEEEERIQNIEKRLQVLEAAR
jgi:hypothetical protein